MSYKCIYFEFKLLSKLSYQVFSLFVDLCNLFSCKYVYYFWTIHRERKMKEKNFSPEIITYTSTFIPRWALLYPLVKPEISVCIPHFLYIRGKQFPFYTTLFPASLIYNRETISILYYFVSRIILQILVTQSCGIKLPIYSICVLYEIQRKVSGKITFPRGFSIFLTFFLSLATLGTKRMSKKSRTLSKK